MLKRIITAAVAIAVLIAILLAPPIVFTIALAIVIGIMIGECNQATGANRHINAISYISALILLFAIYERSAIFAVAAVVVGIILYMSITVVEHGTKNYAEVLSNGLLTMYIVFSMSSLYLTKELFGTSNMVLIFIAAWSTDTFAYFSGRALGKHKLIPHVSPNKTIEGSIGGILGAMVACIIYLAITNNAMHINTLWTNIYIEGAIIGLAGGVISQVGDLSASAIKRDTGIKDFGKIFPGHGGFMDRFDSVMMISPILFGIMYIIYAGYGILD